MLSGQTRINGGLSQQIDNGYLASLVSFGTGLMILAIIMLFSRRARAGWGHLATELRAKRLPWWTLIGGAAGSVYVLSQGLVATVIGVALFTVGIVGGQVVGGLVLDKIGLGPGGKITPTVGRIIGTGLAVVAVVIAVWPDLVSGQLGWLALFPLGLGLIMAWQSSVNGIVRSAARSAVTSTFINFAVGTAVLIVVCTISVSRDGWPEAWPGEPWYYVGGAMGALFIALMAILVKIAGVLLVSMANVAGQLIAAVVLEQLVPLAQGVTGTMIAGAAVALVAVVVASWPRRPRPRRM